MRIYAVLLLTMVIDLDHLLVNPVYDPCRCSIGFHVLHSYPAIVLYAVLLLFKPTRIWGIGLLWHIATDYADCLLQPFYCN